MMIALAKIHEVLETRKADGIFDVQISSDLYVYASLENRTDPTQPYKISVHPLARERTLRIRIPLAVPAAPGSPIPAMLANASISLANGDLRIDSRNGIYFELNHIRPSDDDNGPSPELLGQLIGGMVGDFRQIETLVLQGQELMDTLMNIMPPIS